jgi:hypothetical protein
MASEKSVLAKIASVHAMLKTVCETAAALEPIVEAELVRLRA